jgi:hypothetical protein
MSSDDIDRLINWYYEKGGSQVTAMIEFICTMCKQRNVITYLCTECGHCPRHEGHSETCPNK